MNLGEMRTNKKAREAYENNPRVLEHRKKISSLEDKFNLIPQTVTKNPDGSITSKGEGRLVGGELFTPGQPLNAKQYMAIRAGMSMGNTYSNEIMQSYKMHEEQRGKTNNLIKQSYSADNEQINQILEPPTENNNQVINATSSGSIQKGSQEMFKTSGDGGFDETPPSDNEFTSVKGTYCPIGCINDAKSNSTFQLMF